MQLYSAGDHIIRIKGDITGKVLSDTGGPKVEVRWNGFAGHGVLIDREKIRPHVPSQERRRKHREQVLLQARKKAS